MLEAGTIIICPGCLHDLYILKADLFSGFGTVNAESFEPCIGVPGPDPHSPMTCPFCGDGLAREGMGGIQLFTTEGWVPS